MNNNALVVYVYLLGGKLSSTLQRIHFDTFFDPVQVINVVQYINVSNNVEKLPLFPNFKNQKKPQIGVVP